MTPQEKAKELWSKMYQSPFVKKADAIRCASIAVEEILNYQNILVEEIGADTDGYLPNFWHQVKEEIEKL